MPEEDLSARIGATIRAVRAKAREGARRGASAGKQSAARTARGGQRAAQGVGEQADSSRMVDKRRKDRQSEMFERAEQAGYARAPLHATLRPTGNPDVVEAMARGSANPRGDGEDGGGTGPGSMVSGIGFGMGSVGGSGGNSEGSSMEAFVTGRSSSDEEDSDGGLLVFDDAFGLGGDR